VNFESLKNVGDAAETRQEYSKKRSLRVVNEHSESVRNAESATQVALRRFTLIEIMVVVVILGILAALVVPQVMSRPDQAKVTVAKGDIKAVAAALDMYKLDNHGYPSTQQGLEALVKKPSGNPQPKNWNRDGYLKRMPVDPWGNNYQYLAPGAKGAFDLYSLGADGKDGGSDNDADIGNWDL
jgi:type II secretion system protein G